MSCELSGAKPGETQDFAISIQVSRHNDKRHVSFITESTSVGDELIPEDWLMAVVDTIQDYLIWRHVDGGKTCRTGIRGFERADLAPSIDNPIPGLTDKGREAIREYNINAHQAADPEHFKGTRITPEMRANMRRKFLGEPTASALAAWRAQGGK